MIAAEWQFDFWRCYAAYGENNVRELHLLGWRRKLRYLDCDQHGSRSRSHLMFVLIFPKPPNFALPPFLRAGQLASGWQKTSGINRDDYMVNPVSGGNVTLDHILAAEFIQNAFRRFLLFRQDIKSCMGDTGWCATERGDVALSVKTKRHGGPYDSRRQNNGTLYSFTNGLNVNSLSSEYVHLTKISAPT